VRRSGDDLSATLVALAGRCYYALRYGRELNAALRTDQPSSANTTPHARNKQANERQVRQEHSARDCRGQTSAEFDSGPGEKRELREGKHNADDDKEPPFPAFQLLHRGALTLERIPRE
jgi:hypothetical protein